MISTRYRKVFGTHSGHSFIVVAPFGEIETPMRWMLHMEGNDKEKLVVSEDELADTKLWRTLD